MSYHYLSNINYDAFLNTFHICLIHFLTQIHNFFPLNHYGIDFARGTVLLL